tara:strand:+ start:399 stop:1169 length:771 start_codon:yes stop_codon:yes gene_type:complete
VKAKTIKDKRHFVYKDKKEFRLYHKNTKCLSSWRDAEEGEWCLTDDKQVLQILKKDLFRANTGKNKHYVRTLLGTYVVENKEPIEGNIPKNLYSFSRNKNHKESQATDRNANANEQIFAQYVVKGIDPTEAYIKAYPTDKHDYAKVASKSLLRQERVIKLIRKEVQDALSSVGITHTDILKQMWSIVGEDENNSSSRVRCLELLAKISDMMPNSEKKSETLTVFQGFTPAELKSLKESENTKMIAHAEAEIDESAN